MASPRRIGAPDAKNRTVLLDAAEALMLSDGYAAVTSRRLAQQAGLKPQLVHYYFRTMDDLFLAMFQRRAEEGLARLAEALDAPRPLRALWEFSTDPTSTAMTTEFVAMANHHKALRAEIGRCAEEMRQAQLAAMPAILARYGVPPEEVPPAVFTVVLSGLSRTVIMEQTLLGMSGGHAETLDYVDKLIDQWESNAPTELA